MTARFWQFAALLGALLGAGVSAYLAYVHYSGASLACPTSGHGCELVQSSRYAQVVGVPMGVVGLVGYAVMFVCTLLRGEAARVAAVAIAASGFLFSAYLAVMEYVVIDAFCGWCAISKLAITLCLIGAVMRLKAAQGLAGNDTSI